jgi:predicted alpha/beta-fold hydrolase
MDAKEDPRKKGLKDGLRQLTNEEIVRLLDWPDDLVLDTYNYENGNYCPLAVAIGLPGQIHEPTHDKVFAELTNRGYKVYNTRGICGDFYTSNRREDLILAAEEILVERNYPRLCK